MKTIIAAIAIALWSLSAGAADEPADAADDPTPRASVARQDSLEIPGLTACHQCEWRPKPHTKAAEEQCGMTPDGSPRMGIFECGFSQECDRVCNFVRCAE
jgi:hypothetical protein